MLEVKSVPNLSGNPVSYAYAVKAGPWIFLTGHEAFDFESGIPEEVAGPASFPLFGRPRSRPEGDFIDLAIVPNSPIAKVKIVNASSPFGQSRANHASPAERRERSALPVWQPRRPAIAKDLDV